MPQTIRPRLVLADDHAILLDSLRTLLSPTYDIVKTVTDGRALLRAAAEVQPDVIVTDITMPDLNGLDAVVRLKQLAPKARVIFLTVSEDPDTAAEAIRRGASAYVVKSAAAPELFEALRVVLDGRTYVTPAITTEPVGVFVARAERRPPAGLTLRQREVLQLLAEGKSMKEAAARLGLTRRTVAFHKYSMMKKLGLTTTAQLVRHALALALVSEKTGRVEKS